MPARKRRGSHALGPSWGVWDKCVIHVCYMCVIMRVTGVSRACHMCVSRVCHVCVSCVCHARVTAQPRSLAGNPHLPNPSQISGSNRPPALAPLSPPRSHPGSAFIQAEIPATTSQKLWLFQWWPSKTATKTYRSLEHGFM